MTDEIITLPPANDIELTGKFANQTASRGVFSDYQARKSSNTLRRQGADLALFADFLREVGTDPGNFEHDYQAWRGITWGLVEGFARWQLQAGYAIGSVNVRLATVKTFSGLAFKADMLSATEYALIQTVKGYSQKERKHIDEKRKAEALPTRRGKKKAESVSISPEQAGQLMNQTDTAQGRRDNLLLALMLEHGLRVGEVARLEVSDFDLESGELRFYRPKVDRTQTHKLTSKTLKAARAYFEHDAPQAGPIWRAAASKKDGAAVAGNLTTQGMSARAITRRVTILGAVVNVFGLSAHDLRHYWATRAARNGTPLDRLQDAGGWNSPAMPLRYIENAKIANDGVNLGTE